MAIVASGVILFLLCVAILAPWLHLLLPWLAIYDPETQPTGVDVGNQYFLGPSPEHYMGTDDLGRDVFSRIVFGSRISLLVGFVAAFTSVLLGTLLGTIAGYFSGTSLPFLPRWLDPDILISRLIDFMLTIPVLPLLLVLSALLRDPHAIVGQWAQRVFGEAASVFIIISIIVLFGWITIARLVRGTILSLREQEFTSAARALGFSDARIMFRHLLPNALTPIIVQATLQVGGALLTEAALSFLGFGIQPPVATWGNMLTNAQNYIFNAPWLAFPPGVMILITVLAFNYLGDGLRDALDPRTRR
jgi:ABC-type dipeptide/oligopeptide/nickel transport system permease subunit